MNGSACPKFEPPGIRAPPPLDSKLQGTKFTHNIRCSCIGVTIYTLSFVNYMFASVLECFRVVRNLKDKQVFLLLAILHKNSGDLWLFSKRASEFIFELKALSVRHHFFFQIIFTGRMRDQ